VYVEQAAESFTWSDALRDAVVAADEVAEAHSLSTLAQELERRDGAGAPWATILELELRKHLLAWPADTNRVKHPSG
jgi:hypothetical protein